jgi:hypothetical protein
VFTLFHGTWNDIVGVPLDHENSRIFRAVDGGVCEAADVVHPPPPTITEVIPVYRHVRPFVPGVAASIHTDIVPVPLALTVVGVVLPYSVPNALKLNCSTGIVTVPIEIVAGRYGISCNIQNIFGSS